MKASIPTTLALSLLPLAHAYCPPTGPVLPVPKIPKCATNLTASLKTALTQLAKNTETSFSVQVTSAENTFFDFHHTGSNLDPTGTDKVDGDSVYRLASCTKVFTTLAMLLQEGLNLDVPASTYIPELESVPFYKDTTLRMLAGQMAGVPRDSYMFDLTSDPNVLKSLGISELKPPANVPTCDAIALGEKPCTRSQFFEVLNGAGLTWQPGHKAAYSNLAFILVGFAVENVTGKPYIDVIQEQITGPLNMTSSGFTSDLSNLPSMVIPNGSLDFAAMSYFHYNATGGMFSTPTDLSSFLRGILNNELLSDAKTNAWLKPQLFTSSPYSSVGLAWEIFRPTKLVAHGRPIDVYSKSGGLPGWNNMLAVVPEYDLAFSVLTAGTDGYAAVRLAFDAVLQNLVPEFERLARSQAQLAYAGRYTDREGNSSTIALSVDGGPGLKITEWSARGANVLDFLAALNRAASADEVDVRAYPVGAGDRWLISTEAPVAGEEDTIFGQACESWFQLDQARIAGVPADEIDFVVRDGRAVGVELPGTRQNMTRV